MYYKKTVGHGSRLNASCMVSTLLIHVVNYKLWIGQLCTCLSFPFSVFYNAK